MGTHACTTAVEIEGVNDALRMQALPCPFGTVSRHLIAAATRFNPSEYGNQSAGRYRQNPHLDVTGFESKIQWVDSEVSSCQSGPSRIRKPRTAGARHSHGTPRC